MNDTTNELDQLAKTVALSGGIGDDEAERIASSPFLHTRIRARIEAEQRERSQRGNGWLATLFVASRAVMALLLVTIGSASAFWITRTSRPADTIAPVISKANDLNRVVIGGTCALSSTEQCAISTEEVLATMFAEDRGNGDRGKEEK
ncbi:MAG TPA: hypothetical protein VN937_21895 [Blastocatellia bacterium]|nr:hypothetical protein [Blastocatellia bacterium]